jgi:hypothetical protein
MRPLEKDGNGSLEVETGITCTLSIDLNNRIVEARSSGTVDSGELGHCRFRGFRNGVVWLDLTSFCHRMAGLTATNAFATFRFKNWSNMLMSASLGQVSGMH